jgi:hypothetical protein
VLYALAVMEELVPYAAEQPAKEQAAPHALSSAALEARLAELAARPRRGLQLRSELQWDAPAEIPDLALTALLRRNPGGFLMLTPEVRLRWLEALPDATETSDRETRTLTRSIVFAASNTAAELGPAERTVFEARLRGMDEELSWVGLSSLFGPAAPHLETEVRELLLAHLDDDKLAPLLCGRFLSAIGAIDPRRLEGEVEALLARAAVRGENGPGVILVGLARVALGGPAEARAPARELLGRLAGRAPFKEDASVRELLRFLQIPEPSP